MKIFTGIRDMCTSEFFSLLYFEYAPWMIHPQRVQKMEAGIFIPVQWFNLTYFLRVVCVSPVVLFATEKLVLGIA